MRLNSSSLSSIALAAAGFLAACDTPPVNDAGLPDAGGTDAPIGTDTPAPPGVCATARAVTLTLGANSITGNTAGRGMDLALTCNSMDETPAPQEAITLTIPGDPGTTYAVELSTAAPGTAVSFDTQLEVRMTCGSATNAICNDDIDYPDEPRSRLTVPVPGGTVLTLIVSGYQAMFSGPWEVSATVEEAHPPTLTGIDVTFIDSTELRASIMGGDVDGNAVGIAFEFLDAAGMPIAVDADDDVATPDVSELFFEFDTAVTDMTTFTGTVTAEGLDFLAPLVNATQARVRVIDDTDEESAPLTEALVLGMFVARGATCDDALTFCPAGLACEGAVCTIPAAAVTACGTARAITLAAPTATVPSSMTFDATVMMADGVLTAPCQPNTPGDEDLFTLTVPAGDHDLIVTTAGTRTGTADTVVYVMSTCGDTSADPDTYCADDIDDTDRSSELVVQSLPAGAYALAVETYGPAMAPIPVGVTVTLRAVVAIGAACDPAGVNNRCAGDACTAAGMCP